MPLSRRLVNGRERGCLQVEPRIVRRLVNMSTRAMRLKTQARVLACLQVVFFTLSVVKEQSLSESLVRLEKNCSHYIFVAKETTQPPNHLTTQPPNHSPLGSGA